MSTSISKRCSDNMLLFSENGYSIHLPNDRLTIDPPADSSAALVTTNRRTGEIIGAIRGESEDRILFLPVTSEVRSMQIKSPVYDDSWQRTIKVNRLLGPKIDGVIRFDYR